MLYAGKREKAGMQNKVGIVCEQNFCRFLIVYNYNIRCFSGPTNTKIAIVTVLKDRSNSDNYELAQNLFECYAIYHNYERIVVDISQNETLQKLCPQKDVIFSCLSLFC